MKNNITNLSAEENQVPEYGYNEIVMDYTSIFTNLNYFESRNALQEWVQVVAKKHNMIIVVKRSESGEGKKKPQVLLACERSGEYRENMKRGKKRSTDFKDPYEGGGEDMKRKKKDTGSKKCGCPFLLKGKQLSPTEWTLDVKCGTHNHPVAIYLEGHSYVGRLTQEEEELVVNMSKSNTPAKDILKMLKVRNPTNCSTIRTIYNVRAKNNLNERDGRNHLQHLMKLLIDNKYFHHHRTCQHSNTLRELFFAHPTSIQLFRAFPSILIMDCTYKTNRYRLPYLEMVGITSTGMTFSVASAFLQAEKEENYTMYNVVVITLSQISSLTFLPLRTAPPNNPKSICLGLVNGNHFIQVFLTRDRPLPAVSNSWYQAKSTAAEGWLKIYENGQIT